MKTDRRIWKSLASLTQLSYLILIPILLCLFLGLWIDGKTGNSGIATAILVVIGIAAGLRNLWVWCMKQINDNRREEGRRGFGDSKETEYEGER